ncbi:MAG: transposase [Nitrososphaerota archaeon]|jgi:hypothetical protein|nr:transposase [Nitrososphaerota archaeon]MDG7040701.1 transposase [Nitrososphaerota archaeon]MDG7043479.1 transposase [Nitrososphaerota archaeon]
MLSYDRLSRSPGIFRPFSGLEVSEFDLMNEKVESKYDEFERMRLSRKPRKKRIGAGRRFKLPLRNRLLMLLVYYRLYITSTLTSYLFDVDQTTVLRDIRKLEPAVKEALPIPGKLYEGARRASTPEEVEMCFPGFKTPIDATEQEIPRPVRSDKRRSQYSGKKKRHTVKAQITVNRDGLIVHKVKHARGRRHDYDTFKKSHSRLPPGIEPTLDLSYEGIQKDFPELSPHSDQEEEKGLEADG